MEAAVDALGSDLVVTSARKVRKGIPGLKANEHFEVLATPPGAVAPEAAVEALLDDAESVVDNAFAALLAQAEDDELATSPAVRLPQPRTTPHPARDVVVTPEAALVPEAPAVGVEEPQVTMAEPVTDPTAEPTTAPVAEAVAEPVAELVVEPVVPAEPPTAPSEAPPAKPAAKAAPRRSSKTPPPAKPRATSKPKASSKPTSRPTPAAKAPAKTVRPKATSKPVPKPRAPRLEADIPPGWSRQALAAVGVPAAVLAALPAKDPTSDLAWVAALERALTRTVPGPKSLGAEAPCVLAAHGVEGVVRMIATSIDTGLPVGVVTVDGGRVAPATATELALVLRAAVLGGQP